MRRLSSSGVTSLPFFSACDPAQTTRDSASAACTSSTSAEATSGTSGNGRMCVVVVSTTVPGSSCASTARSDVLPPLPMTDVTPGLTPRSSASGTLIASFVLLDTILPSAAL